MKRTSHHLDEKNTTSFRRKEHRISTYKDKFSINVPFLLTSNVKIHPNILPLVKTLRPKPHIKKKFTKYKYTTTHAFHSNLKSIYLSLYS